MRSEGECNGLVERREGLGRDSDLTLRKSGSTTPAGTDATVMPSSNPSSSILTSILSFILSSAAFAPEQSVVRDVIEVWWLLERRSLEVQV